jgi:endoglucanase
MFNRIIILLISFITINPLFAQSPSSSSEYYHTSGSQIVDSTNTPVHFNAASWFGFETSNFVPHGLWTRSMDGMLDQLQQKGYNLLRIPYTNEMLQPGAISSSINFYQNPDLLDLTPLQILDKLIEKASARGIKIYLDRHRPTSSQQSELWYTSTVSEEQWIADWQMLAKRYLDQPTVIGADLHNEPHGAASWGTNNLATDWRLAAERAGNAILKVNPHWLIIVEGVEGNVEGKPGNYWWGGNLSGVAQYPVRLEISNQLIYSPHDYGPGVHMQSWFSDLHYPYNLESVWDSQWGYIHKQGIAPILIGEFGGRETSMQTLEGIWQNTLVDFIENNQMYWTYWSLNPNSGDTGGLLLDDWQQWDDSKQFMLDRIMK